MATSTWVFSLVGGSQPGACTFPGLLLLHHLHPHITSPVSGFICPSQPRALSQAFSPWKASIRPQFAQAFGGDTMFPHTHCRRITVSSSSMGPLSTPPWPWLPAPPWPTHHPSSSAFWSFSLEGPAQGLSNDVMPPQHEFLYRRSLSPFFLSRLL